MSSNLRIGGLATGMDLEGIVRDLMKIERMKVDKLEQEKTLSQWKQDAYNEINRSFANFILDTKKAFGLAEITSNGTLLNKSVQNLDWIKNAASSNTSVGEFKARTGAASGTYEINVQQLAKNWSAASAGDISAGDQSDLAAQFGLNAADRIKFTITTDQGSVTIDKTNLTNVSLKDIVTQINNADIGVTAVYDEAVDRFFLQTENTGLASTIEITEESTLADGTTPLSFMAGTDNKLKLMHLDDMETQQWVVEDQIYTGKNAVIDFGAATSLQYSSNQFTLNNIDFQLKSTGSTVVNVSTNVDGVYEKISDFVDQYNQLIDKVNVELKEKRYRDYPPLTAEQKEAMTEEEIKLWEEKAKSGLLRNDTILEQTLRKVRIGLYEEVEGKSGIYQLAEFGIETEGYVSGFSGGRLVIREDKLREAIKNDVNSVLELLFNQPDSQVSDAEVKRKQTGLVSRMYGDMIEGMKRVISKAGPGDDPSVYRNVDSTLLIDFVVEHSSISLLDEDIFRINDRIDKLNDYLITVEERYWRQFTAMESAINQMNAQSAWLAQQFGGGQ